VRNGSARDAGTNFNRRIFSLHVEKVRPEGWSREHFRFSHLSLATCYLALAESGHENIYPTDYNSVSELARSSLICAKSRRITRYCHGLCGSSGRPTEPAGDDETDDGAVEAQRKSQAALQPGRQLELHHQILDESRSKRQAGGIKRHSGQEIDHGWPLLRDGCDRKNGNARSRRQEKGDDIQGALNRRLR